MELLVIPYPVIDPIAIELGPVAVRWYGLAYMAGILLGWLYGRRLVSQPALWGGPPAPSSSQALLGQGCHLSVPNAGREAEDRLPSSWMWRSGAGEPP